MKLDQQTLLAQLWCQRRAGSWSLQDPEAPGSAPGWNTEQSGIALRNSPSTQHPPLGHGYSSCKYFDKICSLVQPAAIQRSKNVSHVHGSCFQERCFSRGKERIQSPNRRWEGSQSSPSRQPLSTGHFPWKPTHVLQAAFLSNSYPAAGDLETGVNKASLEISPLSRQWCIQLLPASPHGSRHSPHCPGPG